MQKQVKRGQAYKSVDSVHSPHPSPKAQAHIHFKDGTSLNIDGTVHNKVHGFHILTTSEKWLFKTVGNDKNDWIGN